MRTVVAEGLPSVAKHSANGPKSALLRANKHYEEGLLGATWLLMGVYILPLSPNDHPTWSNERWGLSGVT